MEFRLFGELTVLAAGRLLDVGTPRQQAVLAALIVDARRPVAIETLIDRVWNDAPPDGARNVLYSHLSRIRQMLRHAADPASPSVRIERRHAGYLLDIDPDLVDLHRFGHLVDRGHDVRHADADRVKALAGALGLWRGPPLAAVPGQWAAQVRSSLHRRRLDAAVEWAQAELRLGHHGAVIGMLPDLVTEYPLVEPLEGLLMRALHAAGRGAEALDRYTAVRQRLADDLGTDPGPELRELHQAILRGELPLPAPAEEEVMTGRTLVPPAQLPPEVSGFTGRDDALRQMDGLLTAVGGRSGAMLIVAVSGTAGVGKTALAVHWAHRVRDEFADGQLYVNLRGFDPAGSPVAPAEAVRGFLDAFEVPAERIPASFDTQVSLYRSLLANRRVLVVLDNARDAEQVRPLLPGASGCAVVVTSRNQLSGLVAEGAHPLPLDLLPAAEARELLASRIGDRRGAAEPHAVDEIITLCARLPLALAIVAARAATHPGFGLAVLAGELREARGGLDEFSGTDIATDARAVFSWSYQQQSPAGARLFRLLGLHPGPDVATPAAASLAGLTSPQVRSLLAELAGAHLIAEHFPGRYTFHDLLRAYAAEQARTTDPDDQRSAAVQRALDHYVHTAHTAARLLQPARDPITLTPPQPGVTPEHPADHGQALAWFTTEHAVLLAAISHAARTGSDTRSWQLAWTLTDFLDRRGHWHDAVDTLCVALEAARRLADPRAQAIAHRLLARPYTQLGSLDDAHTHLRHALDLYQQHDDQVGQAHTHTGFTFALERQGRHREALDHAEQALDLFRAAGHRDGEARSLNNVGWYHGELGDHHRALTFCQQSLSQHQELGNHPGQAMAWDSIGYAHQHLGHHAEAIACYRHAIDLFRDLGHHEEAITLDHLGDTHHAAGNFESAGSAWQQSLAVLDRLGHPNADKVRAKLKELDGRGDRPAKRRASLGFGADGPFRPPASDPPSLITAMLRSPLQTGRQQLYAGKGNAMTGFMAYHGVDAATHQQRVDDLGSTGFRPVVLNVSGNPEDARYAAVWVRRSGAAWSAVHGLSAEDYQARFNELTGQGYAPMIVTATGPASNEIFAAVFEQGVNEPWFARHGLRWDPDTDPNSLRYQNNQAYAEGYVPRCLAVYGDPSNRRFAGIWVKNTEAVLWSWWLIAPAAYQRFFDALISGGMRPAALSVAPDGYLLSVFRGDQVGAWHAPHGITETAYQTEFDLRTAEGLRPIAIAAAGVGDETRYAAVFAADDVPVPRSWNVTGAEFAGADELDAAARTFMVRNGIRAGSVAIGRGANIVGVRGYTWAEPGYPITRPETRFRVASLSKIFTAAELSRLVAAGQLSWDIRAFALVGVTSALPAGTPATVGMDAVTVEQLVLRTSHLPRDFGQEQRMIAANLGVGTAPIARGTLLRYLYGRPLVGTIPVGGLYSNAAFYLLTSIVEQASGLPFVTAVQRDVLSELGIHDVALATTAVGARQPDEVPTYDHADVHASQLNYAPDALAPNAYGGDFVLETGPGSGGLLASAASIAKLIARYPVRNADATHLTGREVGARYGTWDGTSSGATSRADGLDFAFLFNRRVIDAERDEFRDAIDTVLNAHGRVL